MKKLATSTKPVSNFELFLLIGEDKSLNFSRQARELSHYHIPGQQLHVLRIIQELGSKATLSEVAKNVERKIERDLPADDQHGKRRRLIKRINDTPKSRLLRIELTDKGRKC